MVDSGPNFLNVSEHRLSAYLQGFGCLAQFCHPSMGDRSNCGSSESRGMFAIDPKASDKL
jgi:hypothetical protein